MSKMENKFQRKIDDGLIYDEDQNGIKQILSS
jgi:hypothetical protein